MPASGSTPTAPGASSRRSRAWPGWRTSASSWSSSPAPGPPSSPRSGPAPSVPVVADESVSTLEEAELAVSLGACDAATLKLSKVGGTLEALRIAAVVPSYLSSALDGPLGIAAALHAAQALPRAGFAAGLAHGLGTLEMFAGTYADHEGLYGPSLLPPDAPGLGVEIDEARLEQLRIA